MDGRRLTTADLDPVIAAMRRLAGRKIVEQVRESPRATDSYSVDHNDYVQASVESHGLSPFLRSSLRP